MVHRIWQTHNVRPAVFLGLCSNDEPFTDGERAFCIASEVVKEESGDRPTTVAEMVSFMGGGKQ